MQTGHTNTTKGNAARAALALCATALALFVLLAASTAQASMSVKGFFGSEGSGAGQLNNPSGIAINQSGAGSGAEAGDLYLADQGNNRVDQFSAAGSFVRAFGAGVVASGPGDKGGSPELQSVKIAAGGGTFTLSYNSAITTPIAFNASPASVEAALNGLVTIGGAGHAVSVTGGPGDPTGSTPYLVSFGGDLSGQDVAELGLNTENLLAGAGGTLTCHTDTQNPGSPLPITSYVWLRNGAPIAGATTETYELAAADAGTVVQCESFVYPKEDENGAEAPNPGPDEVWGPKNTAMGVGAPRTGKAAFVVAPAPATFPPVLTKQPFGPSESKELITGGAGGQKLNCPKGTWSGSPTFTYQWYRAGVPIAGATAQSYIVQTAEIAEPTRFQCTVFATNAGGTAVQNIGEVVTKPPPPHEPVYSDIQPEISTRPYLVDPSKLTTTANGHPAFEVCEPANGDACRKGAVEAADHGSMSGPRDVAVDPASGEVFSSGAALDSGRIEIFGSDGSFEGAFGWGVVDGSPELQFCTAICKEGLPGSKAGQLINAVAMAVDPLSGDLYVADRIAGRVDRFALTHGLGGEVTGATFVNAFGWGVDTGAGAFETCTTASGCQAGVKAGGENVGEFREFALNDIAVSPAGTIYTVECCRSGPGRAQSFTPAGPTYTPAEFAPGLLKSASSSSAPIAVAIGESGHLLIARGFAAAEGTPPAASAEKRILEFDSAGTLLDTHIAGAAIDSVNGIAQNTATGKAYATSTTGGQRVYVLGGSTPPSVTIDPVTEYGPREATFSGTVNPQGSEVGYHFEYRAEGSASWQRAPAEQDADAGPVASTNPVSSKAEGLVPSTLYHVRLVAKQSAGAESATSAEVTFTTEGEAPRVGGAPVSATASSAILGGVIDPSNGETEYHFEYGLADCASNPCASTTTGSLAADAPPTLVSATISGLQEGATYHYRLVATNPTGTASGPSRALEAISQGALPENRAYEQVSPLDKGTADAKATNAQAAASGSGIAFQPIEGLTFPGAPGSPGEAPYFAIRGAGGIWSTQSVLTAFEPRSSNQHHYKNLGFSEDLSSMIFTTHSALGVPGDGDGVYTRDNLGGSFEEIPGTSDGTSSMGERLNKGLIVTSPDQSQIVFASDEPLTPDAPPSGSYVYEWNGGTLSLISKRPEDGTPIEGTVGIGDPPNLYPDHQVSSDGSKIFWSADGLLSNTDSLYATVGGTETVDVGASERSEADPAGNKKKYFVDASLDGGKVFFESAEKLTDDSTATPQPAGTTVGPYGQTGTGELYRYDFSRPAGERLIDVSVDPEDPKGAQVLGTIDASDDGNRIYFVARGALASGAVAGQPNVYLWDYNGGAPKTTYVATLNLSSAVDGQNIRNSHSQFREPLADPSGGRLLLLSTAQLTPYENAGHAEVYLYNAGTDRLECVSCRPDRQSPTGDAELGPEGLTFGGGYLPGYQQRSISSDGTRVFFETDDPLLTRDSNGRTDVYEWHDGQLHLISTGRSSSPASFVDASSSGDDVFIVTHDQLSPLDKDSLADIYDARVNGIAATAPVATPSCEGEACLAAPSPPDDPTPASSTFSGSGNVPPEGEPSRRCPKGKRAVRKGGKKRCTARHGKRHHKKQANHKRRAGR